MKSWPDRLREIPFERLATMIETQRAGIKIQKRDLAILERVMEERAPTEKGAGE